LALQELQSVFAADPQQAAGVELDGANRCGGEVPGHFVVDYRY